MFEGIFKHSPLKTIVDFYDQHKNMPLIEVYKSYKIVSSTLSVQLSQLLQSHARILYGPSVSKKVLSFIQRGECFMGDHYAGFENLDAILSDSLLNKAAASLLNTECNIILTRASITPRHHSNPCSLISAKLQDLEHHKLSVLPRKYDDSFVYNLDALNFTHLDQACTHEQFNNFYSYEQAACDSIKKRLDPTVNFYTQLSLYNSSLYDDFMPSCTSRNLYLCIDELARDSLVIDLKNDKSLISRIIDDPSRLVELLNKLSDLSSSFSHDLIDLEGNHMQHQDLTGTVFFYYINDEKHKENLSLIKEGEDFYLQGHSCKIRFDRESIREGLHDNKLLPNFSLIYLPLIIDHGLRIKLDLYNNIALYQQLSVLNEHFKLDFNLASIAATICSMQMLPISVHLKDQQGFNSSHPLKHLDLYSLEPLSSNTIEGVLFAKLADIREYSLVHLALMHFDQRKILFNVHYIQEVLARGSALKLVL